jgi:hypothetical protein
MQPASGAVDGENRVDIWHLVEVVVGYDIQHRSVFATSSKNLASQLDL